jgi:uncharacterized protein (DUF433 family)
MHCRRGAKRPGRGEPNPSIRPSPPGFGAPKRQGGATETGRRQQRSRVGAPATRPPNLEQGFDAGGLPTLKGLWYQIWLCRPKLISVGQVALLSSGIAPQRVSGAWVFQGTRIPVAALFENLEDGVSLAEFVELFPGVTEKQARLVLEHVARSTAAAVA